jgi:ubiquinone/menaquinone biosynthesis C-methylase UbiE
MIDPKEIIKKFTVEELCETADNYFKAIPDPTPLMAKPFNTFIETPTMLQNMGLLLSGLQLAKTMTVLEFAAGTCWFSRYLNQAQCITISCDVSETALEIGKRLFKEHPIIGESVAEPRFLHFDGHKFDLPDESVDRILCHDGLHHVPNQEAVLAEFARVLKQGGIAGFCEPGENHSKSPASQYEMKHYNVLENDIFIADIFDVAQKQGFTDIKLKLLSDMEVSLTQHQLLIGRNKNPEMLSHKVELENGIINHIAAVMTDKTIFFLYKGAFIPDSRSHAGLNHAISTPETTLSVKANAELTIPLQITNIGIAQWLNENIHDIGVVKIGSHLYDESANLIEFEFSRHGISKAIAPGEAFEQAITVKFPQVGVFKLAIDLLSDTITWFELGGAKPLLLTIQVE